MLTKDLMNAGSDSKLVITTCADMLNHMPQIMSFVRSCSISPRDISLSSDFYRSAKITIKGESLEANLGHIQEFLEQENWRK